MPLVETIDPDLTINEIMERWPDTIRVMLRHRMLCIGCPIGDFHTIGEACAAHGIDVTAVLAELVACIGKG